VSPSTPLFSSRPGLGSLPLHEPEDQVCLRQRLSSHAQHACVVAGIDQAAENAAAEKFIADEKFRQDRPGPNTKAESINQAESDARVKKGLEEIKKAEKAKAKLNKKKPTVIKTTRGGGGIRGPLGGPGGGAMGWENK
jgi:hypothetical protein